MPNHRIHVHCMAKAPIPGWCKTRFARTAGPAEAAALQAALLDDTARFLAGLSDPRTVHLSCPAGAPTAVPRVPGARVRAHCEPDLGRALDSVLAMDDGASARLFIGTDSPAAVLGAWAEARAALVAGEPVLGPTHDGGVYLIGVPAAWKDPFAGVPWGTDAVHGALAASARRSGLPARVLAVQLDLDEAPDLAAAGSDPAYRTHAPRMPATERFLSRWRAKPSL